MKSIFWRSDIYISRECHLTLLISLIFLVVTSCQRAQEPVSREPITYLDLCGVTQDQIGTMDDGSVRNWIEEKYGSYRTIGLDAVLAYGEQELDSVKGYIWGDINDFYVDVYLRRGILIRVSLNNIEEGLTFGQVVDDMGPPDWVHLDAVIRHDVLYHFQLDYPRLGFSVGAEDFKSTKILSNNDYGIELDRDMSIDTIECYSPNPMEIVLKNDFIEPKDNVSFLMESRSKWSGFETYIPITR